MKKTSVWLLLLLTVTLAFVGCNDSDNTDTTADTTLPATESDTMAVESVSAKTEITTTTEAPETTDAADTETTTAEDTTVTTAEATVTTTAETTTEAPTETTTPAPETPRAPTEIGDYIELGKFAFKNWDNTRQAVIIRSQAELADLQPTVGIKLDKDFSFDNSSIVIVEFVHHSEERITGFYGFDVVNGKVCPIITVETPTDPNAAIPENEISTFALVTVPADSIAGMLGEVLVVVPDHIGAKSQHHKAYRISAPTEFDWCIELGSIEPKDWNYYKDAVLIRAQSELDALGISANIDSDEPFSFEKNWLVLICFRMSPSDEIIDFYGFEVVDGEVCPIITVKTPDVIMEVIYENFLLVSIPANSISGNMGDLLANNLLNSECGSAYHEAFVPKA